MNHIGVTVDTVLTYQQRRHDYGLGSPINDLTAYSNQGNTHSDQEPSYLSLCKGKRNAL
jgi:hypothetical protein